MRLFVKFGSYPKNSIYADLTWHLEGKPPRTPVEQKGASWYIKMGFAGFNSPANNRAGYNSEEAALSAIRRYQAKGNSRAA